MTTSMIYPGKSGRIFAFLLALLLLGSYNNSYAGAFTASGSTLTLDLDVASQLVTVVATSTTYTFTLSGGATNTWTGTTSFDVTVSGAVLTVTAAGISTFTNINITDSQTGNAVTFATSGVNSYSNYIDVTLDNAPGAVTFNGSSSFTGTNGLSITTSMYITFAASSSLTTENGDITLSANMQVTPSSLLFSGITVNNAKVEITGTGILSMTARGGTGTGAPVFANKGIAVISGGLVKGGTTGTMNIEGRGYTGVAGTQYGIGVLVTGTGSLGASTISSIGANVSVTGYGAVSTAACVNYQSNIGVVVGEQGSFESSVFGTITSGDNGTVTISGYGGTALSPASSVSSYCCGVMINSSNSLV